MWFGVPQTILVHGYSRVVGEVLTRAAKTKNFNVIVTEGRPDAAGFTTCTALKKAGIPTTLVLDSAMGCVRAGATPPAAQHLSQRLRTWFTTAGSSWTRWTWSWWAPMASSRTAASSTRCARDPYTLCPPNGRAYPNLMRAVDRSGRSSSR